MVKSKLDKKEKNRENPIKTTHPRAVTHEKYIAKEVCKLLPRNASFKVTFTMLLVTKLRFYHHMIFKAGTPNRSKEV